MTGLQEDEITKLKALIFIKLIEREWLLGDHRPKAAFAPSCVRGPQESEIASAKLKSLIFIRLIRCE